MCFQPHPQSYPPTTDNEFIVFHFPAQYIFFPPPSLPKNLVFHAPLTSWISQQQWRWRCGTQQRTTLGYIGLWREMGNLLNDEICLWIYFRRKRRMGKFGRHHARFGNIGCPCRYFLRSFWKLIRIISHPSWSSL